ncbi:phage major capsid protein, P2 family [Pseudoalteromonas luteoviolacea]|uniref:phage major capsid protein, P2 family n=1 Tax=Pseudoalteromonas luteoviolacea TaxID=43657 RepID=UPI001B363E29|nr:phage major capsid protein, P2 family [Pseudoalteromonas luteoviolacea]MBQ4836787.1 phage major capsid protein, P2 family [Pseudoalteromonas luteoviolacea]
MRENTTKLFKEVLKGMAVRYGVSSMLEQFNVSPSVEQALYDEIYESAEFLTRINRAFVRDKVGQPVFMGANGGVTQRAGVETDDTAERQTRDVLSLRKREYRLYEVECDVHIRWDTLDTWARFKDFVQRYRNHVKQMIALDIIKCGWHGIEAKDKSDINANPLLQDVNVGWLQLVRNETAHRAIKDGKQPGEIRIGPGGDYENLDQAVNDLKSGIPVHKRTNLIAIIGDDLTSHDKNKLYAKNAHTPSEKSKIEMAQIVESYGGLHSYQVPFFPSRGVLVTSFDNLSHYVQRDSTRTHVMNNPKKKQIEDYLSRNDGYFIEDPEKIIFFESEAVKIEKDDQGNWS